MKKFLKKYFDYSQNEIRGILVLLFLIICGLLFPKVHSTFKKEKILDYSEFEAQIDQFIFSKQEETKNKVEDKAELFNFDPNSLNKLGFLKLGLSNKTASTIVKYRSNGGVFYKKSDLKKIYGLTDEEYKRLSPYIKLAKQKKNTISKTHNSNASKSTPNAIKEYKTAVANIELNTADSAQLTKIVGIGPVFASRIIKYRSYLGGYYSVDQLKEVYGFSDEMFSTLSSNFMVDTTLISKININKAGFKSVNKHPYLTYKHTKSIFVYRQTMHAFTDLNQLLENNLLDSSVFKKVRPYITLAN